MKLNNLYLGAFIIGIILFIVGILFLLKTSTIVKPITFSNPLNLFNGLLFLFIGILLIVKAETLFNFQLKLYKGIFGVDIKLKSNKNILFLYRILAALLVAFGIFTIFAFLLF